MRKLWNAIAGHFWLKLFSLAAAAMLWIALIEAPELTTSVGVPVEFRNFPSGLDIASNLPGEVRLQVRGPRGSLASSSFAQTAVVLDLAKFQGPGVRTFDLAPGISGLPPRVQVVRTDPFQLRLALENHAEAAVPVTIRLGRPSDGIIVLRSESKPSAVKISGPKSKIEPPPEVETDPFEFGTMEKFSGERILEGRLHIFVDNPRVRIESATTVDVKVYVRRIGD
jgi:hypothetical protein